MQTLNPLTSKELYSQYNWYKESFLPVLKDTYDDFFQSGFQVELLSISENINALMGKDFYFVTKIRIDKQHDAFFRCSQDCVSLILNKVLGKNNKRFSLDKLTDLEAKIMTSFNDNLFNNIADILSPPSATEIRRTNFDVIHLTFLVKDNEENVCGKFILSLPKVLLKPDSIISNGEKFANTMFKKSTLDVNIKIGSTKFSLLELKNLDIDDTVVFENSNTKKMTLSVRDYEKEINLKVNLGLVTPIDDNNGGNNMGAENLWDSIEVEMIAEFDSVKITLGELKNIEAGNVVDLTSLYENKVTLKVENKTIAKGELVIINDRYGVKITDIVANNNSSQPVNNASTNGQQNDEKIEDEDADFDENETEEQEEEESGEGEAEEEEEEFDYSDFELEDEDI